ncbi:hypothetical protein Mal35_13690 [Gimesia maris]|uniref:hypothetical protein n=1 Tax=Gimesia maris TaxID=122 RepID=UPI00118800E7|nr:hypothetical protein [Gimesia maris]QDT77940.1 hypothetical protein Mal35_13690 [Gimesia maris]
MLTENIQNSAEEEFKIDMTQILKENPRIDIDQVREAEKISKTLESAGVYPEQYGLSHPFSKAEIPTNSENSHGIDLKH